MAGRYQSLQKRMHPKYSYRFEQYSSLKVLKILITLQLNTPTKEDKI